MQLVAQIRRVRRAVPEAKALELTAHDYDNDPGKPACAWDDQEAIDAMVSSLVGDACARWPPSRVCRSTRPRARGGPPRLGGRPRRRAWRRGGTWRIAPRTAPDRMVSVIDPDSLHVHKTVHNYRDGFKAHMAIEPDTGLITACDLTAGNVGDGQAAVGLLEGEPAHTEVLADLAYGSADVRRSFRRASTRPSSSFDAAALCHRGWIQHRRLHCRHNSGNGHLPQRDHRQHHSHQQGRLRRQVSGVSPAPALHEGQERSQTDYSRAPRPALCRAERPSPRSSRPSIAGTGPWSNAPSPGWWPRATAGSPTAASPATRSGWPIAVPPSTCVV